MLDLANTFVISGGGNFPFFNLVVENFNQLAGSQLAFGDVFYARHADRELATHLSEKVWKNLPGSNLILCQSMAYDGIQMGEIYADQFLDILAATTRTYKVKTAIGIVPYLYCSRQDPDFAKKPWEFPRGEEFCLDMGRKGLKTLLSCEIHSEKTAGYCSNAGVQFYNVKAAQVFADKIRPFVNEAKNDNMECFIFCPDVGSIARCVELAKALGLSVAVSLKHRNEQGEVAVVEDDELWQKLVLLYGEIIFLADDRLNKAWVCTYDDIWDTGGTAVTTGRLLKSKFKVAVLYGCFVHPVLSGNWRANVEHGPFDRLLFSNTVYRGWERKTGGTVIDVDLSPLVAQQLFEIVKKLS